MLGDIFGGKKTDRTSWGAIFGSPKRLRTSLPPIFGSRKLPRTLLLAFFGSREMGQARLAEMAGAWFRGENPQLIGEKMAGCITTGNEKTSGKKLRGFFRTASFACLVIHIALPIERDSDNDNTASAG
jgi:hypothetical protein